MKRLFVLILAFLMLLALIGCGEDTVAKKASLTAEQVTNYFAQEGMPIGNLMIFTEETDPNNQLGRPNSYTSKVNFEDERTLSEQTDTTSPDYIPNNTLEVFETEKNAKARYDYLKSISDETSLAQYMYLDETMLLRLDPNLLPKEAEKYEALLKGLYDHYDAVIGAPKVTHKIDRLPDTMESADPSPGTVADTNPETEAPLETKEADQPESVKTSGSQTSATETMGQRNAVKSARSYLDLMAFSRSGLITQLKYEGYSTEEATYAVDNAGADWNKQAAKSAQSYLDLMAFSRSELISQLVYEGFTQEQANYGVTAVGY